MFGGRQPYAKLASACWRGLERASIVAGSSSTSALTEPGHGRLPCSAEFVILPNRRQACSERCPTFAVTIAIGSLPQTVLLQRELGLVADFAQDHSDDVFRAPRRLPNRM
jgi:hypothetical protein